MPQVKEDIIRVVIADDEPLIRMDLKELLEESSTCQVVAEARDGAEVIELVKQYEPDIVFMDIRMPNKDGIEAAKELQLVSSKRVPIIMLTAYSQPELYEEASRAGVFAYLTKPLRKSDLAPAIEVALARALEMYELQDEINELSYKLETRKVVEKAKGVLMKKYEIDEPTAYRRLQKAAMDERKGIREVADQVLAS
jgi:two-component system, response regulator PdtaR